MKINEEKLNLLKTNYNYWSVVSSSGDRSQLTKFEGRSLCHQHVADVKTSFLKTGFDNTISCLADLNYDNFFYQNNLVFLYNCFEPEKYFIEVFKWF